MGRGMVIRDLLEYDKILLSDKRAISKAISVVENDEFDYIGFLKLFARNRLDSDIIGITGPPGVGKSTLIARLVSKLENEKEKIGIIMVDPTSPLSGGAILGDRLRLGDFSDKENVYIRSMASRGKLGGLSYATFDAVDILSSAGFKNIIVESVGIGQQEIDLKSCADVLILIVSPESGDFIQAMKAGIIEVADIIVVNKSDREGSDLIAKDLQEILSFQKTEIAVLQVSALRNEGIDKTINEIKRILQKRPDKRDKFLENVKKRIYNFIERVILQKIAESIKLSEQIKLMANSLVNHNVNNFSMSDLLSLVQKEIVFKNTD